MKIAATKNSERVEGTAQDLGLCQEPNDGEMYITYFNFQSYSFLSRVHKTLAEIKNDGVEIRINEDKYTLSIHGYTEMEVIND